MAYLTFETDAAASEAIAMSGTELDGRWLKVSVARPRAAAGSTPVCFQFAKGNCTFGESCRFSHGGDGEGGGGGGGGGQGGGGKRCYRCGGKGHNPAECQRQRICYKCKGTGHLSSQCPNKGGKK